MLSLARGKGAVKICDLVHSARKKQDVYFLSDFSEKNMNKVEDVRAVVQGHLGKAKTRLRVNQESLESAIGLLQAGSEPDADTSAHISKSFWHLRELKKKLLSREMDIRDQKSHFEINFPTKLEQFFGHVTGWAQAALGKGIGLLV